MSERSNERNNTVIAERQCVAIALPLPQHSRQRPALGGWCAVGVREIGDGCQQPPVDDDITCNVPCVHPDASVNPKTGKVLGSDDE
jgi:hypothetical protein